MSDKSAVCDWELLRTFLQSAKGTSDHFLIIRQNPEQLSILPGIGLNGFLAVKIREDTFNARKYKHFLKHNLVCISFRAILLSYVNTDNHMKLPHMNRYPGKNSILVCNNACIHRGPRVEQLCDDTGVLLIYLPPYCLELNPIELCFMTMKS